MPLLEHKNTCAKETPGPHETMKKSDDIRSGDAITEGAADLVLAIRAKELLGIFKDESLPTCSGKFGTFLF